MKKFKKILALALSLAMVLGMSVTTFAANSKVPGGENGAPPKNTDKATITVKDVEEGATVTAFQIVKAKYKDDSTGFLGYEAVEAYADDMEDYLHPTAAEVGEIAQKLPSEGGTPLTSTETAPTTYSAEVGAGYWVVVVTESASKSVYNPMLLGVYYSESGSDNTMVEGEISATTKWNLNGEEAYAKKTEATIEKTIVDSDNNNKGDSAAAGSTVKYQIESVIPTYSKEYSVVTYKITDTLSSALSFPETKDVKIMVDGKAVYENGTATADNRETIGETTVDIVTSVTYDGKIMTITFNSDSILARGGKKIVVTYSAVLKNSFNDDEVNFIQHNNKAEVEYTNSPATGAETVKKESKTYHYTFGLDAKLFGNGSEDWNKTTTELLKGELKIIKEEGKEDTEEFVPLNGAEFQLKEAKENGKAYTAVSSNEEGKKGYLSFTGLDEGNYTLVETKAPNGYSLNSKVYDVNIAAEYNTDGTLNYYTVTIDGVSTKYTATYNDAKEITDIKQEGIKNGTTTTTIETVKIPNTKLSSLPSTGGIGTTIFTIGGCAIMILAAALYFASRRKTAK